MKRLPTAFALAGLAGLSLGLPAHHAGLPSRADAWRPVAGAPGWYARTAAAAHATPAAAPQPVQGAPAPAAPAPKPAEKPALPGGSAGATEGVMVGPDGVIYRREGEAR